MVDYVVDLGYDNQIRLDDGTFTNTTFEGNLDNFMTSPLTPLLPRHPAIRIDDGSWLVNTSASPSHQLLCRHNDGKWFAMQYYGAKVETGYTLNSYACANDTSLTDLATVNPTMYSLMAPYSASILTAWGTEYEYFETGVISRGAGFVTFGRPATVQFDWVKGVFNTHTGYTYSAVDVVSGTRTCGISVLGTSEFVDTIEDFAGAQLRIYRKTGGPTYPFNTTGRTDSNLWYPGIMSVGSITVASVSQDDSHTNGYTLIHSETLAAEYINEFDGIIYAGRIIEMSDANGYLSSGVDNHAVIGVIYLPAVDLTLHTETIPGLSSAMYTVTPKEVFPA